MSQHRIESTSVRLNKIPVPLSVRVCGESIRLDQILEWVPGTVLTFDQQSSSSLQLRLGQQNIASGRVVKLGPQLGFRVESIQHRSMPVQAESR